MARLISGAYVGTPHAHLMGRPGAAGKLNQQPVRDRRVVKLPPVDGSPLWRAIHSRALGWAGGDDSAWLADFRRRVPCGECRKHWDAMVAQTPPDWTNYFAWTVARHNEVNQRLGKAQISEADALAIWGPAKPV